MQKSHDGEERNILKIKNPATPTVHELHSVGSEENKTLLFIYF